MRLSIKWRFLRASTLRRSIQIWCTVSWKSDFSTKPSSNLSTSDQKVWQIWTRSKSTSKRKNSNSRVKAITTRRITHWAEVLLASIKFSKGKNPLESCATKSNLWAPPQEIPRKKAATTILAQRITSNLMINGGAWTKKRSSFALSWTSSRQATAIWRVRSTWKLPKTEKSQSNS